jgi:hypothetical protein
MPTYIPFLICDSNATVQEIIQIRGGEFIESYRKNNRTYIKFKCNNGHISSKRSDDFKKTWCNQCQKLDIQSAYNLAKKMNGLKSMYTVSVLFQ